MFVIVIVIFVLIGMIEMIPMIRAGQKKEMVLYSFIFLLAFVVCLLLSLNIKLPSPAKPMNDLYESVVKLFSS